ncbi:metallophosphoesterase family protein [Sporosarcina siberiensis]|uniref:Metallophosphoesterase family protein n=1 Tax=Sporosarcina siberiensis TaxID=1365606 RepID=A0ABW4SIC3_9BACL
MYYAFLGDIHSSMDDLKVVLEDISNKAPEAIQIGTGDLFECTISKKKITNEKFRQLEDVMIIPDGFVDLLTFDTVIGNQEERILLITETNDSLRYKLGSLPEIIEIDHVRIIHGHQFKWGGVPWSLIEAEIEGPLIFYGHSHQSELWISGVRQTIEFGVPYSIGNERTLVNVGAVVSDREWVLYNKLKEEVTFMKTKID